MRVQPTEAHAAVYAQQPDIPKRVSEVVVVTEGHKEAALALVNRKDPSTKVSKLPFTTCEYAAFGNPKIASSSMDGILKDALNGYNGVGIFMSPREPDFEMIAFEQVKEFMRSILTTVREHATRESMYLQADMCFVELGDDSCTDHISHHAIGSREVVAQGIDTLYYDIPNTDSLDKPASFTRHLPSLLSCRIFHNDTQLAEAAWIDWPFPLHAHNTDAAVQRAHEAFCDAVVSMTESQQPVGESRSSRSCTAETLLPYLKDRLVTIFMQLSQYTTAETDTPVNNMMQIASRFQSSVNYVPCSLDNPPKRPLAMEDDLMILDAQPPSFDKSPATPQPVDLPERDEQDEINRQWELKTLKNEAIRSNNSVCTVSLLNHVARAAFQRQQCDHEFEVLNLKDEIRRLKVALVVANVTRRSYEFTQDDFELKLKVERETLAHMMRVHDDDERYMDSLEAERGKQAERAEMAEQQLVAMKKQFHSEAASKQQEWLEKEEALKAEVRQLKDQLAGKDHTLQTMRHEQNKMHIKYEANQMLVKSQAAHQERRFHRELDDMHQDAQDQIRNLKQKYNIIIDKLQEENRQLRWNLSQQSQPHVPLSSSASSQPLHDVPRLASFHDITHDDTENQLLAAYMRRKKAMAHSPLLSPVLQPLDDNKPENQEINEIRSPRDRQQGVSPPNPQDFSRDHGTTPRQRLDQPHRVSPATDARATPTVAPAHASIEPRSTKTMLQHANYPIPPPPRNSTQNTRPVLSEITPLPLSEHDEIETTPEQQDGESEIAIEIPSRNPSPQPPVARLAETTDIHAEDDHVAMEPLPVTESMLEYERHTQSDASEPKPISMRHSAAYQHDDVDSESPDNDSDQLLHRVYDDQDDSDAYDPGDVDTTLSRSITRRTTRSTTQIDTEDDDDLMASLAPPRGVKGKGKAVSSSPARPTKRANGRPRSMVETVEDKDTTPSSPTSPTQTQTPTRSQTQAQARRGRPRGRGQGQTRPKTNTGRKRGRPAMARVVPPTHVDENDDAPTTKPRKGSKSSPARQQTAAAASQDNEMDQTQPSQESEGLTSSQATTTKRRRLNRTRPKFEEALSTTPIIENYHKDVFAREDAERALAEQRTRQRRMEREQKKFVT